MTTWSIVMTATVAADTWQEAEASMLKMASLAAIEAARVDLLYAQVHNDGGELASKLHKTLPTPDRPTFGWSRG